MRHGVGSCTVRWLKNWLSFQDQRVVVSSKVQMEARHGWCTQGPALPVFCNFFTNDLDGRTEHTRSKFTDSTKGRGEAETPESCPAIWRILSTLEKWTVRKHRKFGNGNSHVLSLERNKPPQTSWEAALRSRSEVPGGQHVSLCQKLPTATGGLEGLWILHLWRYLKPDWTQPWVVSSSWLCFEQRVELVDV